MYLWHSWGEASFIGLVLASVVGINFLSCVWAIILAITSLPRFGRPIHEVPLWVTSTAITVHLIVLVLFVVPLFHSIYHGTKLSEALSPYGLIVRVALAVAFPALIAIPLWQNVRSRELRAMSKGNGNTNNENKA